MDVVLMLTCAYATLTLYFADVIKVEREKAIKEFLVEQLKRFVPLK